MGKLVHVHEGQVQPAGAGGQVHRVHVHVQGGN